LYNFPCAIPSFSNDTKAVLSQLVPISGGLSGPNYRD
jgi:hypothetical protein